MKEIEQENDDAEESPDKKVDEPFKKPVFIGKMFRLTNKISLEKEQNLNTEQNSENRPTDLTETSKENKLLTENEVQGKKSPQSESNLPYKEPSWSGLPQSNGNEYILEVLKNGSIIETINLMSKPYWVFGRLNNCNVFMQHPTISRYHAVLQYREEATENQDSGFYIYDLSSTHGTFLNKNKLKPEVYARMQVGHMIKFGGSTRSYILSGPEEDTEEESELSVTELKQKRADELKMRQEAAIKAEKEREERLRLEEERGVDWGLGEDADEETDLSENPFAQSTNEDLYLDDPKKALRGFFEREGLDLEYVCTEQGIGQFMCKVELPVDDEVGRPVVAEVVHKGKKKEAVVQCALEACRILDRYGVLRQATHESRKRKTKNWEENDYYDSDEDNFFDRTGEIEKKRQKRMNALSKQSQKTETYESLLQKEKNIAASILDLEKQLATQKITYEEKAPKNEEDSLDAFMKGLKDSGPEDKQTINKLKLDLTKLKAEHSNIIRLVNLTKPTDLPPLITYYASQPSTSQGSKGKIQLKKIEIPEKNLDLNLDTAKDEDKNEEHSEEKEEESNATENFENQGEHSNSSSIEEELFDSPKSPAEKPSNSESLTFEKFQKILKKGFPPFTGKYIHQEKMDQILNELKKLATNEDRIRVDWKILSAKKRKVMKLISDLKNREPNERLERQISSELNRILTELNQMTEEKCKVIDKVKKMGNEIKSMSEAMDEDLIEKDNTEASTSLRNIDDLEDQNEGDEKRKMKNLRRIVQRKERADMERRRAYEEDASREDYNMWVPPSNQSGDGRTSLNERLGY